MPDAKHVVIVGGGFCGVITAINLTKQSNIPLRVTVVNSGTPLARGVAYSAYSNSHLLNVRAGNMSAFPDDMQGFVKWAKSKNEYSVYEDDLLSKSFLPRNLYGNYLFSMWENARLETKPGIQIGQVEGSVFDLEVLENGINVILENASPIYADKVILATGNSLPANPAIKNMKYYSSSSYFRNSWNIESVKDIPNGKDVLIVGSGLSMVDTVIGLKEHGFEGKIYSVSTNGFGILSHRHQGITYTGLVKELSEPYELKSLVTLVRRHIKMVRKIGLSAEPVIDSLRPYSHKIWQSLSPDEKKMFMRRFRFPWGVARHRISIHAFDFIEELKLQGNLLIHKGRLADVKEVEYGAKVTFSNRSAKNKKSVVVGRVINCTGPECSIYKSQNPLLSNLAQKGIISSDLLELGINADIRTFNIIDKNGKVIPSIYTLGNNLKGMLWESVAVPELRIQCKEVAQSILNSFYYN